MFGISEKLKQAHEMMVMFSRSGLIIDRKNKENTIPGYSLLISQDQCQTPSL